MGDQIQTSVKAGKDGVFVTVKAMGMEINSNVTMETRANGKVVTETVSMGGMELAKAETEMINEGTLTGAIENGIRTDIEFKDLKGMTKEQLKALAKDFVKDFNENSKAAMMDKIRKVAPDMLPILTRTKKLVKDSAPAVIEKLPIKK
jgi:hypothetical protein